MHGLSTVQLFNCNLFWMLFYFIRGVNCIVIYNIYYNNYFVYSFSSRVLLYCGLHSLLYSLKNFRNKIINLFCIVSCTFIVIIII